MNASLRRCVDASMYPAMRRSVSLNSEKLKFSGPENFRDERGNNLDDDASRKRVGVRRLVSVAVSVAGGIGFDDRVEVEERVKSAGLKTASGLSALNNGGFSCREEQKFEDVHVEFIAR